MFWKRALSGILLVLLVLSIRENAYAADQKQVTIVNPIRGSDFWQYQHSVLDTPKAEYRLIKKYNLPATWLIRYDALTMSEVVDFLRGLDVSQEVGLFLEVTPKFAQEAGVTYNKSDNWHFPKSVFLVGYSPQDREKLIDTAVKKYQELFGKVPKSVGAWWIDAYSLNYLHQKYGVEANLDVSDQYSTDHYQVWGQYFSLPFYPSKLNALFPAASDNQKLGVVTIQWATRDPFNSYGNGVGDSTFSVQVNDYMNHELGIDYFKKLLAIYPQVTIGLENDFDFQKYGQEYDHQLQALVADRQKGFLNVITLANFANWYSQRYPKLSPSVVIEADDPLGSGGKVVWYQTPKYRAGWFYNKVGSLIRDLRVYNEGSKEICYEQNCQNLDLATTFINSIDEVTYGSNLLIDQGRISDIKVSQNQNEVRIDYVNQSGVARYIRFLDNDVDINSKVFTLQSIILEGQQASKNIVQKTIGEIGKNFDYATNFKSIAVDLLKFLILSLVFFVIPGWLLTRRLILTMPLGWVIFSLLSYLFGLVHWQWLIWCLPVVSLGLLVKVGLPKWEHRQRNIGLMILILVGSLSWLLTVVKNGLLYPYGLGFWGPNGHDAVWHISLINELNRNFVPNNPVFAGVTLSNYHYFFDLLVAKSAILLGIDVSNLFFRFFPLMFSLLSGWLMYQVVRKMYSPAAAFWATFFLYFGGSFGFVVTLLKDKQLGGESMFWSQQAVSTLLNLPFAISVVLFLAGFYLLIELLEEKKLSKLKVMSLILVWGSLVEFKAYAGMLVLFGLGSLSLVKLVKEKDLRLLGVFLGCLGLALAVFLPNNLAAGSLLVFSPLWLVNGMIDFPDRLGWQRLAMARATYQQTGNSFKLVVAEVVGLIIFIVGNLGTRLVLMVKSGTEIRSVLAGNYLSVFLMTVFLAGLILPLVFIQKGTNWNIVQFFYYSLLVANIFAGAALSSLMARVNVRLKWIIVSLMLLVTLPTTYSTLQQYWPSRPPAALPVGEVEALNFLKTQEPGTVLTYPFDDKLKNGFTEPLPLVAYAPSAYVSAFSNHPTFLDDTINLEILNIDQRGRLNEQNDFFKLPIRSKEILARNNIKYVYVPKLVLFHENEQEMGIQKIFENDAVKIFKAR